MESPYEIALLCAIKRGYLDTTKALIKDIGNFDFQDSNGYTPLMWTAWKGDYFTAFDLIKKGVSLDISDNIGDTALMTAANKGHNNIVKILVDAGHLLTQEIKMELLRYCMLVATIVLMWLRH